MGTVIYHAAKDENKKYKNGKAGDQTKAEVYSRSWYNYPWTAVYEPPTVEIGKAVAEMARLICENDNIGYDQNQRNSLLTQAKKCNWNVKNISVKCECDCSSLGTVVAIGAANAPENTMVVSGNCATSSTIGARLKKCGWKEHTGSKYIASSNYIGAGWILVAKGKHVAINGTNGKYYNGGSSSANSGASSNNTCPYKEPTTVLKYGSYGTGVSWLQWHLNTLIDKGLISGTRLNVDGNWGRKTSTVFKAFQTAYPKAGNSKGKPDGKCGSGSRSILKSLV